LKNEIKKSDKLTEEISLYKQQAVTQVSLTEDYKHQLSTLSTQLNSLEQYVRDKDI